MSTLLPAVDVEFLSDCVGMDTKRAIDGCGGGKVFLLENLRFHIEETGSSITEEKKRVTAAPEKVPTSTNHDLAEC